MLSLPFASISASRGLTVAIALLFALLLIDSTVAIRRQDQLVEALSGFAETDLERVALLSDITENVNDVARKLVVLLLAPREQRVLAYTEIDAADRRIDAAVRALPRYVTDGTTDERYREVAGALARFRAAYLRTAELIEAGETARAQTTMINVADLELSLLVSATESLGRTARARTESHVGDLVAGLARDRQTLVAMSALGLLLSVGVAAWVLRSVARPMRLAAVAARRYAQGDVAQRLDLDQCREVREISVAFNLMVDEAQQRETVLRRMVDIDFLTGLFQRTRFVDEHAERAARAARGAGPPLLLLCFDVERLKSINSLLGFDAGDHVLVEAARIAREQLRSHGDAARLGGGTFVALLQAEEGGSAVETARAFQRSVERRMQWHGHVLDLAITVGVAQCPGHGDTMQELLRRSEQALFEAKRLRVRASVYTSSIEAARSSHLSLLSELQRAIASDELIPFLQPKFDLRSGRVTGAEALARWRHPQRGWVSPAEFIPFAERAGRIDTITWHMLRKAVELLETSLPDLSLAVNISTQDLRDSCFVGRLGELLGRHRVRPDRLHIEITETGLLQSGDDPIQRLAAVRAMGVRIAIDDFGTGQSSMAYLQRLPAHELKIDRSFVHGAAADSMRRSLFGSIVGLGHSLGLTVTGEGVETSEDHQMLVDSGCDIVQGYLVAKPMPAAEFIAKYCRVVEPMSA